MVAGIGRSPHHQQGLALITAVLVVAIVATVAVTLALGEQVWFRQAQNMTSRAQAESLRRGALNYAAILLARDDATIDHLGELWAKPLPPLPVEDGMIAFKVQDEQGRFNLNNLAKNGTRSPVDIQIFQRLLSLLDINQSLGEALSDWIDTNLIVDGTGGAEDIDYLSLPQPYRTANQSLQSVDELRLVKGFGAKEVEKLRPFVTAIIGPTLVNVNTAPEQVLAALTNLSPSVLHPLIDSRVNEPFKTLDEFNRKVPPTGTPCPTSLCDIKTSNFMVTIDIRYGRLQRLTEALIERTGGKATVKWHRPPPPQIETKQ